MMNIGTPLSVFSLGLLDFNPGWDTCLPHGVGNAIQLLDDDPNNPIFNQTTINPSGASTLQTTFKGDSHSDIGSDKAAGWCLSNQADNDDVPVARFGAPK